MSEAAKRRRRIGLLLVVASIVGSVIAWLLVGGPARLRRSEGAIDGQAGCGIVSARTLAYLRVVRADHSTLHHSAS